MPVSVPVNAGPYGDGSILHASPQMGGHPSVSPRPSSSTGMLDVGNNGYPPGEINTRSKMQATSVSATLIGQISSFSPLE